MSKKGRSTGNVSLPKEGTPKKNSDRLDPGEPRIGVERRPERSGEPFWLGLTAPQAALLAAVIAAIVSLVGAGISLWTTSSQRNEERSQKTLVAYGEALKAIRHMKSKIQVVIADKNITFDNARTTLLEASSKLDGAWGTYGSVLTASDYYLSRVFHDTKSPGRRAWSDLERESEQGSSKLSAKGARMLIGLVEELETAETKLEEKYISLTNK